MRMFLFLLLLCSGITAARGASAQDAENPVPNGAAPPSGRWTLSADLHGTPIYFKLVFKPGFFAFRSIRSNNADFGRKLVARWDTRNPTPLFLAKLSEHGNDKQSRASPKLQTTPTKIALKHSGQVVLRLLGGPDALTA